MSDETEKIIDLISDQTKTLLQDHWQDIDDFRNGGSSIKVGFNADISYEGQKRVVETKIGFNKRITDSVVNEIDTEQMHLPLESQKTVTIEVKRGRGRPKKNIIATELQRDPLKFSAPPKD